MVQKNLKKKKKKKSLASHTFKKQSCFFLVDVSNLLTSLREICSVEVMKDLQHNVVFFSSLNVAISRINCNGIQGWRK